MPEIRFAGRALALFLLPALALFLLPALARDCATPVVFLLFPFSFLSPFFFLSLFLSHARPVASG